MEMLARLGNVLYWLACIAAVGAFSVPVAVVEFDQPHPYAAPPLLWAVILGAALAIPVWLVGLACRYVLSGPRRA